MSASNQKFLDLEGLTTLIAEMDGKYLFRTNIMQTTGNSEHNVMSQAAVTKFLSRVYEFKGSVQYYENLPTEHRKVGDVYNIVNATPSAGINAGDNVAWDGEKWDKLAGIGDLTNYVTFGDEFVESLTVTDDGILIMTPNKGDAIDVMKSIDDTDINSIINGTIKSTTYANVVATNAKFLMSDLYPTTYATMTNVNDLNTDQVTLPVKTEEVDNTEVKTGMFQGCAALTDVSRLNTSSFTDMTNLFKGCAALTTVPKIDCSAIVDAQKLSSMFEGTAVSAVTFTNVASAIEGNITSNLIKGAPDAITITIE